MANIDRNLSYTFVTSLDETDLLLTSDYFLVSEPTSNSQYISKKLPYGQLCSLILVEVNDKIDSRLNDALVDLSSKIDINALDIRYLSSQVDNTVTAIIKIANCVQTNKSNIGYLSTIVSMNTLDHISCGSGISLDVSNGKYKIGHSNAKASPMPQDMYKFGYDSYGHVSSSSQISKDDIVNLGIPSENTTYDIASTTELGLVKLATEQFENTTDRYALSVESDGIAFVDVPVHQVVSDAITDISSVASENHLGLVSLCADAQLWGDTDQKYKNVYPLKVRDTYAYVQIPPQTIDIGSGVESAITDEHAITSITYSNGIIESVGSSNKLSARISTLSTALQNNYLDVNSTKIAINKGEKSLELRKDTKIVSKIFLTDLQAHANVEIDRFEIISSYQTMDVQEAITSHDVPASHIVINTNGIQAEAYADIPFEDWIFTLDDGTTVTKRVTVHSSN